MDREQKRFTIAVSAIAAAGIAALAYAFSATEADAQQRRCGPVKALTEWLAKKHNEAPIATAQLNQTAILQIWRNEDGSTFTAISINTAGIACMLASGHNWTDQDFVAPVNDEES